MSYNQIIKVPRFKEENGFYTTKAISNIMSKIRSKNTKPEIALRKALWSKNIRYRLNVNKLPGKPDIVIEKNKLVIFIDGEYWHGYNWEQRKAKIKNNREYWVNKIERNMQRDIENRTKLSTMGYTVLRFWEFEIKKDLQACVQIVISYLD